VGFVGIIAVGIGVGVAAASSVADVEHPDTETSILNNTKSMIRFFLRFIFVPIFFDNGFHGLTAD
jgi:hypothetical protein